MRRRARLSRGWLTVLASALGLMVGPSIQFFSFGVFLKPVSHDLGLSRSFLSLVLFTSLTLTAIACPVAGALVDRFGVRRVVSPVIVLFALSTAALSLIGRSPTILIFALFGIQGVLAAGQSPATYAKAIAGWFDRERGLALGVAMAGVGLGMAVIPKLASVMILHLGWRAAYVGLGLTIFAVGFFPVIFLLREPPERALSDGALSWGAGEPGLTAGDAVTGSWRFWALVLAFLLAATAINGTLNSIIALLTDRGVSVGAATSVLAVAGLAAIAGRLVCGFSLDRLFGPYVAIAAFAAPMAGIGVLASGASGAAPLLGAVLCGLGVGAEVDLMPFFASRYFGMAQFGRIYGLMFGAFTIGSGLGPYVMGLAHDRLGSYLPALTALAFALSISCLLMMRLGPYPYPRREAKNGASDRDWPSMPLSARAG